jgi:two-component system NtrC family sensor kinase
LTEAPELKPLNEPVLVITIGPATAAATQLTLAAHQHFSSLKEFRATPPLRQNFLLLFTALDEMTWKANADFWVSFKAPFSIALCEDNSELVMSVINSRFFSRVGLHNTPSASVEQWIGEAAFSSRHLVLKADLMRQVSSQNRRLEDFRSNLEKIVADRTQHVEVSKVRAEEKQKSTRDLVKFLRDLSQVDSIGDLLSLIRRDLRRTSGLMDPVLIYRSQPKWRAACFRSNTLQVSSVASSHLPGTENRTLQINDIRDQEFLVHQLGRPVTRVIAVPMVVPHAKTGMTGILYVEHNLSQEAAIAVGHSLIDRYQPVAVTLDRILVTYGLSKASTYWEKTFDAIPSPIAIIDEEFRVFRANQQFLRQPQGATCHEQFFNSKLRCDNCPLQAVLETRQPAQVEVRQGDRIFEVSAFPVIFNEERATTVVNHYLDVTDDRKFYGQVLQNEKMIALGLLAGNLAHELNNPLTGMRSMSQLLSGEVEVPERVQEDLREIEMAIGRSQNIVKNLLEFSQPAPEELAVPRTWNHIVEITLPVVKLATREHNLEVYLDKAPAEFAGNPQMLSQVVFNLVNNACQAMTTAGTVAVKTYQTLTHAVLEVGDSGPGISAEIREKLFTPFFTTKAVGQGTGLGLSMSLNVVRKFGGEIKVESEIGSGTKFSVWMPLLRKL